MASKTATSRRNARSAQKSNLPDYLLWMHDAPLFIDDRQVRRFYDAVVRPAGQEAARTESVSARKSDELKGELTGSGSLSLPDYLTWIGLKSEVSGEGTGSASLTSSREKQTTVQFFPIDNAERQLTHLTAYYLLRHRKRMEFVRDVSDPKWRNDKDIAKTPRKLVFLDFWGQMNSGQGTVFQAIPTAAEFRDGHTELFYEQFRGRDGSHPPVYPEDRSATASKLRAARKEYWNWFATNVSATRAMIAIEQAATKHNRIRWINYRVPLTADGESLHLHLEPNGSYNTGVFGYEFIKRGSKHGLRIVGTLKSEPAMNVLAVYEK